jgi:hypothetical protein
MSVIISSSSSRRRRSTQNYRDRGSILLSVLFGVARFSQLVVFIFFASVYSSPYFRGGLLAACFRWLLCYAFAFVEWTRRTWRVRLTRAHRDIDGSIK